MSFRAFRDYFQIQDAANASFVEDQTSGLAAGQYTQPFDVTPFKKPYVSGVWFKFQATTTATAAEAPTAGTDDLDLYIGTGGDIEVAPAAGAQTRSISITRQFAEFVWAVTTDTNPNVPAAHTFAGAGSFNDVAYLFVPIGGEAASVKAKLAGAITAVYAANVTIAYTHVKCYVVSSEFSGVAAFSEENTPSLGTNLQSMLNWLPKDVAPDAIFMKGESSATITQATLVTTSGTVLVQSTDTDICQLGANYIANTAGVTYTTTAGFVLEGNGEAFRVFQLAFASAATHFIGYVQIAGGQDFYAQPSPATTKAQPAVEKTGTAAPGGGVTTGPAHGTGGGGGMGGRGSAGGIISRRSG